MQKPNKRVDRRVWRTRKFLRDALVACIEERGYEGLSVQDLTDRALIGRTTFYEHYPDKEALLTATLEEMFADLAGSIDPLTPAQLIGEQQTVSVRIFEHVAANRRLYQVLLSERSAASVAARLRTLFADLLTGTVIRELVATAPTPLPADLIAAHAAGSLFSLIVWWIEHELCFSPQEMGQLFRRLTDEGVPYTLGFSRTVEGE
ncbi:MAG TPA: TetR/AcrR family transcriptional regulator [Ktedonosporobacter sp.]|nr:TetR/AcrR family transcriptional regulator [Ktedonosporobacter sp.]